MGKKKGKKGKSEQPRAQPSGSQQAGSSAQPSGSQQAGSSAQQPVQPRADQPPRGEHLQQPQQTAPQQGVWGQPRQPGPGEQPRQAGPDGQPRAPTQQPVRTSSPRLSVSYGAPQRGRSRGQTRQPFQPGGQPWHPQGVQQQQQQPSSHTFVPQRGQSPRGVRPQQQQQPPSPLILSPVGPPPAAVPPQQQQQPPPHMFRPQRGPSPIGVRPQQQQQPPSPMILSPVGPPPGAVPPQQQQQPPPHMFRPQRVPSPRGVRPQQQQQPPPHMFQPQRGQSPRGVRPQQQQQPPPHMFQPQRGQSPRGVRPQQQQQPPSHVVLSPVGSPPEGVPPQQQQQPPSPMIRSPIGLPPGGVPPWQQQQLPPQRGPPSDMPQQTPRQPPGIAASVPSEKQPEIQQLGQPQQRGPKKGKKKGAQQAGPEERASTSHEPPTKEMSKLQIPGTAGQGDPQLLPIEYIQAKPGVKGNKIQIETNHISLNLGNLKTAIHYDVNLVPDIPRRCLRDVLELFRQKHYSNRYPAFDGRKNLYSSSPLPFGDFIADEIALQERDGNQKKFKVEIKFANTVDLTPLQDLLKSKATPREAIQVVDIVLRSAPAVTCISAGRSFFVKPPTILDLGEGMEMYNGFYQSAIRGWKPFLNVDVAHKAFPKNLNVTDALLEILSNYNHQYTRDSLRRPMDRCDEDVLNKFIKGLRVSYEIPGYPSTRRVYRSNGIDQPPSTKIFKLDNGESISIEKYFEKRKNYRLKYPHLPSIWVGAQSAEKKILLPLELCTIVEGQAIARKMTESQTSKMIGFAATNTTVRKQKIMTSLREAKHNSHPSVKEFGFSVGNEFEKLEARVLNAPTLTYSNKNAQPFKGVWKGEKFWKGMTINKWTIVCVDRRPPQLNKITDLATQIWRNAGASGMIIAAEAERPFQLISSPTLHEIKKYFQTQKDKEYDVIFVIVPNNGPQYSYVKTAAEINVGCLTQCIKTKTLNRLSSTTVINILLKVNSKLNGTNHCLHARPPILDKPCMIMGADVTHPGPDAKDIPSVAAVTASHDPKAFRYNICWRLQPPKTEIIEDLKAIVIEQLRFFYRQTRSKPERIIFFRDGVSEGQFEQVRSAEIRAIRAACKQVQEADYEPAITFLVVQKRHHTRLFPIRPQDAQGDKNLNVPPGTCVDTVITHPFMQDFYLVSHASIQGVAKPTKYCTLWDDNAMTNDDIEELTYFLCHMFSRCNRSVSYPAPTYYAHLAAARAKVYIENERLDMDNLKREFDRFQIKDVVRKERPMFFV